VSAGLGELPPDRLAPDRLLPGERLLWSARPGRVPVPWRHVARKAMSLVFDAAIFVLVLTVLTQLRHQDAFARREGPAFWLVMALVLAALVLPALGDVARLALLRPAQLRQAVYQVSNLRVLVTSGRRPRFTWSAYLDQIEGPAVTRHADGTADLNLAGAVVMYGVREPDQVMQVIADARPRMLDDAACVTRPAGAVESTGLVLDPGEQVLWTGRPRSVPWWFGSTEVGKSLRFVCGVVAFGLLAGVVFAGVAAAQYAFAALALAALYLAAGRVIARRQRIRHSRYVLTDRRLIVTWRGRGKSVAQAPLIALRPPTIWGQSLMIGTVPARPPSVHYWKALTWPAATNAAPSLIRIDDPVTVRDLICAAQLARRASIAATKSSSAADAV
jgi:hypothetical protein